MVKLAVNGACGRMGSTIIGLLADHRQARLTSAYEHPGSDKLGQDVGGSGITLESSDAIKTGDFDVLIEFSRPDSAVLALQACAAGGKAAVVGVTGFSDEQSKQMNVLSQQIPIVHAPNMSLGVNLCFKLIQQTSATIGADADIDILELHHRHKKDSPSGTSLKMGEIVAQTLGLDLRQAMTFPARYSDHPREENKIGFQVIRGGDTVGEHTVIFTMDGERVEITHRAFSRSAFARGAILAAIWLHGKEPGLYGMNAVIGD